MVSEEYQQAVIIAQSRLASVGVDKTLENGTEVGEELERYSWTVQIQPLKLEVKELDSTEQSIIPYQVTVTVEWLAGENNRQLELTTIKLSSGAQ